MTGALVRLSSRWTCLEHITLLSAPGYTEDVDTTGNFCLSTVALVLQDDTDWVFILCDGRLGWCKAHWLEALT